MFNFTNIFSNNYNDVIITVKTVGDSPLHPPQSTRLTLTDNLLTIRQKLEKDKVINDTLLFSRKFLENNNNSNKSYGFAEIALEKEEKR